jgi:hypothetical protein
VSFVGSVDRLASAARHVLKYGPPASCTLDKSTPEIHVHPGCVAPRPRDALADRLRRNRQPCSVLSNGCSGAFAAGQALPQVQERQKRPNASFDRRYHHRDGFLMVRTTRLPPASRVLGDAGNRQ